MRKHRGVLMLVITMFVAGYYWYSERDWQTLECTGYIVGKYHGANQNHKMIARYSPRAASWIGPMCEDEYGLELQARMGDLRALTQQFEVDRATYEAFEYGDRITIRYRERASTRERNTLAVIAE